MNFDAKNFSDFANKYLLVEGEISMAKQDVIALLNKIVSQITRTAEEAGFEAESIFVDDIKDHLKSGKVEIQAGQNAIFEGSQIVEITIYDEDDIVITIPSGVSEHFDIPQKSSFREVSGVINFIKQFGRLLKSNNGRF